jgi:hypothetical protein
LSSISTCLIGPMFFIIKRAISYGFIFFLQRYKK